MKPCHEPTGALLGPSAATRGSPEVVEVGAGSDSDFTILLGYCDRWGLRFRVQGLRV